MPSDYRKLRECRLCNNSNLFEVMNFKNIPLANNLLIKKKKVKKYPLKLNLCKNCGHLQLSISVKPEKMFRNYLYMTNTSKQNSIHFKEYSRALINKYNKFNKSKESTKKKILDIASNDGTFLSFFNKNFFFRLGIDPAKNLKKISEKKGINQISEFFSYKRSIFLKKKFGTFNIITANHVCAHVDNLNDFFYGIKNLLSPKGMFAFEVSYRGCVVQNNTFDIMYHEHIDYHALKPLNIFLKKHQLNIYDFEIVNAQGGSLRIYATKEKNKSINQKIIRQISYEKKLKLFSKKKYQDFTKKIKNLSRNLKKILIDLRKKNKIVLGYGAAAKTTILLNVFRINEKLIKYVLEDNDLKVEKFIPGVGIKIISSNKINNIKPEYLVIFAWNYSDFIIKKNLKYKRYGGKFIIPFPKIKII